MSHERSEKRDLEISPGQATLQRMYILHVVLLPFVVTSLIAVHIGSVWVQDIAESH